MNDLQRQQYKRFLQICFSNSHQVQIILNNWESIIAITKDKRKPTGHRTIGYKQRRTLFETLDKSLPLLVDEKLYYVSLLYNKHTKEFLFDIREWTENNGSYVPDQNGITVSTKGIKILFSTMQKIFDKWSNEIQ